MSSGNYSFTSRILFFVWIVYWIPRFLYLCILPSCSLPPYPEGCRSLEGTLVLQISADMCMLGRGVSGSYVLWRKKGHCFEHAGAFYFLTTVLLRPKGRPFSNLTARGLFLPSWRSIFQSTQRQTMLSSSGLISRFCRKCVSPHSHMTNPEWILGAQSILLTLLWSCPWKQWERISDQSRQVLHSEAKDF